MSMCTVLLIVLMVMYQALAYSSSMINEPVQACVIARDVDLTNAIREKFAQCLGWHADQSSPICLGSYQPLTVTPLASPDEIKIMADRVSFYQDKPSTLAGNVEIQQGQRVVNAQTAYVYRDPKSKQITKIEFLGNVHYLEPDKLLIARKATINPQDKSGKTEDVLYRFNVNKHAALLPAWGRARLMQRFPNSDYLLRQATYTTCAPQDKAWSLEAKSIVIDDKKKVGVARDVKLRIREWPILYVPYLSFPTTKERKSGFLMPLTGYSNVGGFDLGIPYYWNIAPNYDLTLTPQIYTKRNVMLGGEFRYLTANSMGRFTGNFLPNDAAFRNFLNSHADEFPSFRNRSNNRWLWSFLDTTQINPNLRLNVNVQQVSDDYYFQDFSTNLALITQRQLLRQADLTYSTDHWTFRSMVQSFQTLHPINETPIADQYERLPQLHARGYYYDLPAQANLNITGQYDQFFWPTSQRQFLGVEMPQGPRFHFNPVLSLPQRSSWGFITPSGEFVENYYQVQNNWNDTHTDYNRFIPRFSTHGGLFFDRNFNWLGESYTQTLEPSLFYLYVPFYNQNQLPIYDTANLIFNFDQLFRTNRFSGFDRIGDANQLSYALTTRWLSERSGVELASFSIGQIKYFSDRRVQLCRSPTGYCVGSRYEIGQVSPFYGVSPIASRAIYHFNPFLKILGDYVWDPATSSTNNGNLNLHYQPKSNAIINVGYSYLINGDVTKVRNNEGVDNALHQGIVSVSWPISDRWSTLGAYSYNISKDYSMMSLLGMQYDSCCWAVRIMGGRTFKSLNQEYLPQYNNNIYLQILLKGLGSVANSDPGSVLNTYIPGYNDPFHQ
ncbi:LPS-assembly protein LptD [Fluoribacter dumoffii]|uniref:LPS-assembly protein LptD n=1 Tax=Fluoribacter dumoffii TaxID=463 RepID=A0A377GDB8_9GAMM|nr:LPS-assembly protein LptD [Fluoribacter dumoffii]KTC91048.1 organic solvent tolerance protein [Fluoribacter dumoffii NY 23]MCW8416659.1 LPS-assembly protein LptD [Fluoribacter dumoffii]MCW8455501.1 LPS-assembly protein LptD [Fluoribacter dumoffii]MCW8460420.1 LPS-assembly protein LptD [Fluoribacter dumoffii]MCW8483900.1 LPS-assembly protein LptD [Fluoribacter dumoffii]